MNKVLILLVLLYGCSSANLCPNLQISVVSNLANLTCRQIEASLQDSIKSYGERLNLSSVNKAILHIEPYEPSHPWGLEHPWIGGDDIYVDGQLAYLCHEIAHIQDDDEGNWIGGMVHKGWDRSPDGWYLLCTSYEACHWFFPPESTPNQCRP